MKSKRILSLILAALLLATVFVFAGCNNSNNDSDNQGEGNGDAQGTEDTSLDDVKEKGKLILGLDDSFPPMGFRDDNNEIVGFDIDLAKAVAQKLEVELVLQPVSWSAKEMELDSGNIDCIWNGMSIDPERAEAMNLSKPYLENQMVFVVPGDSEISTMAELAGLKVAVQNGSTAQKILEASDIATDTEAPIEIIGFQDNMTALLDMEAQGNAAVFMDQVVAEYIISENAKDYEILEEGLAPEEYAIGFRKADQALKDAVWTALLELKAEGVVAEIATKWFGSDVTIIA